MPSGRIDRLEERLAWLERHVVEQDKAMLALHDETARLRAEMKKIRDRPAPSGSAEEPPDPAAERPPHY